MVNKPLISPYFWGRYVRGGWLTSHKFMNASSWGIYAILTILLKSTVDEILNRILTLSAEWFGHFGRDSLTFDHHVRGDYSAGWSL